VQTVGQAEPALNWRNLATPSLRLESWLEVETTFELNELELESLLCYISRNLGLPALQSYPASSLLVWEARQCVGVGAHQQGKHVLLKDMEMDFIFLKVLVLDFELLHLDPVVARGVEFFELLSVGEVQVLTVEQFKIMLSVMRAQLDVLLTFN